MVPFLLKCTPSGWNKCLSLKVMCLFVIICRCLPISVESFLLISSTLELNCLWPILWNSGEILRTQSLNFDNTSSFKSCRSWCTCVTVAPRDKSLLPTITTQCLHVVVSESKYVFAPAIFFCPSPNVWIFTFLYLYFPKKETQHVKKYNLL